jgi:hypothetical protein
MWWRRQATRDIAMVMADSLSSLLHLPVQRLQQTCCYSYQPLHLLSHRTFRMCCFSLNFNVRNWSSNIFLNTGAEVKVKSTVLSSKTSAFVFIARQHYWAQASLSKFRDHTQTLHTRWDSSTRVIGLSQRPLTDNTHNTHKIHTSIPPGEIRTRNPRKRAPQTHTATGIGSIISNCSEN